MTGPASPADTEAAALDAAAAATPSSDVQSQELAVRLVTNTDCAAATDRQAAYEAALAHLAQVEEEAAALHPSTPMDSSAGGSASPAGGLADLHSALLL
jgi:hypothetical protein